MKELVLQSPDRAPRSRHSQPDRPHGADMAPALTPRPPPAPNAGSPPLEKKRVGPALSPLFFGAAAGGLWDLTPFHPGFTGRPGLPLSNPTTSQAVPAGLERSVPAYEPGRFTPTLCGPVIVGERPNSGSFEGAPFKIPFPPGWNDM